MFLYFLNWDGKKRLEDEHIWLNNCIDESKECMDEINCHNKKNKKSRKVTIFLKKEKFVF